MYGYLNVWPIICLFIAHWACHLSQCGFYSQKSFQTHYHEIIPHGKILFIL